MRERLFISSLATLRFRGRIAPSLSVFVCEIEHPQGRLENLYYRFFCYFSHASSIVMFCGFSTKTVPLFHDKLIPTYFIMKKQIIFSNKYLPEPHNRGKYFIIFSMAAQTVKTVGNEIIVDNKIRKIRPCARHCIRRINFNQSSEV